ncbi:NucA/NucB deoxyribonuclease domain-containing protein [Microbacterium phyllosphaerae]|uniref:NucA/NucB deoxyribonuclease domain-containing protein n=1 Tax=Microbacterium phyllosphaerae TaxID=124798 RepID=UPI000EA1A5DE|nr:hypothetical protein [Microbacterium phyllosphaerae]
MKSKVLATASVVVAIVALLGASPANAAGASTPAVVNGTDEVVDLGAYEDAVGVDEVPQDVPASEVFSRQNAGPTCTPSGELELCVEMNTEPEPDTPVHGTDAQARAIVGLPQWCLDAGVTNSFQGTRTSLCGISSGDLTVTRTTNGVVSVVGTMNFLIYNYIYMDTSNTTWAHQIQVSPTIITGQAAGTQISATAACAGGACTPVSQSFPTQTPGAMQNAEGEAYWQWVGVAGQQATGLPSWTIRFKAPSATNAAALISDVPVPVRCDNAVPGRAIAGCVVPAIAPSIWYDGSSFTEFGAHVAGAQASGLPGGTTAAPLNRLVNAAAQQANRNTACPASLPRPTGKSCDEYPFASTYQGAALSGGGARTQSWCQVTVSGTPSAGPAGYSVCMIDAAQNSAAGSLLNSVLFVPNRVLDSDAFTVRIV